MDIIEFKLASLQVGAEVDGNHQFFNLSENKIL